MGLFNSKGFLHLEGINDTKHLTTETEILSLPDEFADKIYVPVVEPGKGLPIKLVAKVGDEVKVGTLLGTRNMFGHEIPVYSTASGKIIGEEMLFHNILSRPAKHLVIENDFKYEKVEVVKPFNLDSTKEEIIEGMKLLGCCGLGGAGFPTFIKYLTTETIDTLIINGVECEPFLTTDYFAMINSAEELVQGTLLMLKASGANKAYICVKENKKAVIEAVKPVVANYPNVELKLVPDVYPMGWEKTLIKQVTGRTYKSIPAEAHIIVNNSSTAIELYNSSKTGTILTHKQITVSGEGIAKNANVIVPIGTKVSNIVKFMGGYTLEEGVLLLGGPMCSKGLMNDNTPIYTNVNGITCLPKVVRPAQTCLRCGVCTSHCPAGLQPVEIKIAVEAKNMDRMIELDPSRCVGCGLCSYDCPSYIEVYDFVKKAKTLVGIELMKRNKK